MKPQYPLFSGVLIAALSCLGPQVAWAASKTGDQVKKARVSKAKKTIKRPTLPKASPEGVSLVLETALREPAPISTATPATTPPPPAVIPVPSTAISAPAPVTYPAYNPPYNPLQAPYIGRTAENPYLPRQTWPAAPAQAFVPAQATPQAEPFSSGTGVGSFFSDFALNIPILPGSGQSILPTIKKVYPTGEKPLVVVSFKCPTELVGITPPTIKLLREVIDLSMEGLNKTDLLSFNLQQVCQ